MTMVPRFDKPVRTLWMLVVLALALVCGANSLGAQTKSQSAPAQPPEAQKPQPPEEPQTRITPEEAQQLFRSVDEILKFASKDTKLPIKHPVKRELAGREQVRKFVETHMQEDKDTQRLQRS